MLRDLRHPDGGFFSAEDADSEGIEGKFYLWSLDELTALARRRRRPRWSATSASPHGGNFEDPHTGYRGTILHVVDRTEDRPDAVRRVIPRLLAARAAAGAARARRQGAPRVERAVPAHRSWKPRPRSTATTGWTPRTRTSRSCSSRCGATTAARPAVVAGRPRERHPRLRRGLRRAGRSSAHPGRVRRRRVAARGASRRRRDAARCSATTSRAASSPPDATPKRSSCARRTTRTTRRRRRTRSPRTACCGSRALTGEARATPTWPVAGSRALAPVLADHPTAFAYLLGALDRAVHPSIEVAIVGEPDRSGDDRTDP